MSGNIKDDKKAIKLMVPVDLSRIPFDPPINSREAARLCMDNNLGEVDSAMLKHAMRYSWFAKASYGLQSARWRGSETGDCFKDCLDGVLSSKFFPKVLGASMNLDEHFKKRNFDAILKYTGIPIEDFLYVSYTNTTFGKLPYLVMLDRENKKLVISIRGTVGLEDLVTDLLSKPVEMGDMLPQSVKDALASHPNIYAHEGILSSAKAIIASLEEEGILSKIDMYHNKGDIESYLSNEDRQFSRRVSRLGREDDVRFSLERAQTAAFDALQVKNYEVVITGHSLGAAVASFVSIVLKEQYPSLTCFAFNPPGGLVSPALSQYASSYITSIVVGFDAISRLSVKNVKNLIDDVVFSLCRCKRPKLKIAMDVLLAKRKDPLTAPKTYCSFEDIDESVKQIVVQYIAHSTVHNEDLESRFLVPVGRVVLLRPYIMEGTTEWDAVYAQPDDIVKEGIIVNKLALGHHRMDTLMEAFQFCIDELGG
jgi:hypothetical protein